MVKNIYQEVLLLIKEITNPITLICGFISLIILPTIILPDWK